MVANDQISNKPTIGKHKSYFNYDVIPSINSYAIIIMLAKLLAT